MTPQRGFHRSEYEQRVERVQRLMLADELDAIVLTTEPHVRYFSGFFTPFWHSPTRPWFLVVPLCGQPVAVIPQIGLSAMRATWLDEIYCWPAPNPEDDGISLLASTLKKLPGRFSRIGFTLGLQSRLRMPVNDFQVLTEKLSGIEIVDTALMMHQLLSIKSELEIQKIRYVCEIVSKGFEALPELIHSGETQRQICQKLRIKLLQHGADDTPFMAAASGQGGYESIIMGPADVALQPGDVLIIDTGTVFDGYFSDFDRNYGFGSIDQIAAQVYRILFQATQRGIETAKPGIQIKQLFHAMSDVLVQAGAESGDIGRMGHGLGMQLTEWPSITATEQTVLQPGMVLTLEPAMCFAAAKQMVHEENIVITDTGCSLLSRRAWPEMPVIE